MDKRTIDYLENSSFSLNHLIDLRKWFESCEQTDSVKYYLSILKTKQPTDWTTARLAELKKNIETMKLQNNHYATTLKVIEELTEQ
jgi:hypothetical protein